jgi:hypothetical protein
MDFAGCSLAELIDDPLISLLMKSDGATVANSSVCSSESRAPRLLVSRFAERR